MRRALRLLAERSLYCANTFLEANACLLKNSLSIPKRQSSTSAPGRLRLRCDDLVLVAFRRAVRSASKAQMILEHLPALNQKHIVLASASPRRAALLKQVGFANIDIIPSQFAEGLEKLAYGGPAGYARETARCKALDVARSLRADNRRVDLIIGADTVVEIDDMVLEKPGNHAEAFSMLRRMSGRQHQVHTGVTLITPSQTGNPDFIRASSSTTVVEFDDLSDAAIEAYIATGEPFDKAGSYGAQGPAGLWIKRLEGCYFNVMGLPLHDLALGLRELLQSGKL